MSVCLFRREIAACDRPSVTKARRQPGSTTSTRCFQPSITQPSEWSEGAYLLQAPWCHDAQNRLGPYRHRLPRRMAKVAQLKLFSFCRRARAVGCYLSSPFSQFGNGSFATSTGVSVSSDLLSTDSNTMVFLCEVSGWNTLCIRTDHRSCFRAESPPQTFAPCDLSHVDRNHGRRRLVSFFFVSFYWNVIVRQTFLGPLFHGVRRTSRGS
jgi:hypothetical protein